MACPIHRSNLGSLKQLQPCDLCKVCSFPLHLVPVFTGSDSRILLSFNPSPGIPAWSCSSLLLGRRLGQIVGVHMEKRGKLLSSVMCRSFQGFISLSGAWGMQGWTRSCSSCCQNMWEPIPILFFFFMERVKNMSQQEKSWMWRRTLEAWWVEKPRFRGKTSRLSGLGLK